MIYSLLYFIDEAFIEIMVRKECASFICITGLCLCHVVYVQAVIQCAHTLDEWNRASVLLQCQEPKYYHCLPDENGRLIQKCFQRILVPKGILNEEKLRMNDILVNASNSKHEAWLICLTTALISYLYIFISNLTHTR